MRATCRARVSKPCCKLQSETDRKQQARPVSTHYAAEFAHNLQSLCQKGIPLLAAAVVCLQTAVPPANSSASLTADEERTIQIFKQATPSVVSVKNLAIRRDVFTLNMLEVPQGAGSGFLWDQEGHVVTNFHVINDASDIQVTLAGGIDSKAKVIGVDPDKDIAVLQMVQYIPDAQEEGAVAVEEASDSGGSGTPSIDPSPEKKPGGGVKSNTFDPWSKKPGVFSLRKPLLLPLTGSSAGLKVDGEPLQPLSRCSSSTGLQVGQRVFAIGNPFGLDHTLTTGVVSGTGREIQSVSGRPIQDVIQTDAAINPGNSGGPLLDSSGCLIGINTAIYSPSGANSGVGFAIPVDIVENSVQQIIATGRVVRPILGISFAPEASSDQLGVKGILVLSAKEGGPAAKAGVNGTTRDEYGRLVLGDIITGINGQIIKSSSDLYRVLDKCQVGDEINIEVLRGNAKEVLKVTLESNSA